MGSFANNKTLENISKFTISVYNSVVEEHYDTAIVCFHPETRLIFSITPIKMINGLVL